MASVNLLAEAVNQIKIADRLKKKEIIIKRTNNLIKNVLNVLKEEKFIEDFEIFRNERNFENIKVKLLGKINEFKVITPRLPVKYLEIVEYEMQYLPSYTEGILIISNPEYKVISSIKAKEKKVGGRLIAFVY
jgi:ribosomal protein S8